jgi:hypothetical protein
MKFKVHFNYGSKECNLQPRNIKEASLVAWLLTCTNPNYMTIVLIKNNLGNSKTCQVKSSLLQFVCNLSYA